MGVDQLVCQDSKTGELHLVESLTLFTYSFCIALTTAFENGAELVDELIMKLLLSVGKTMQSNLNQSFLPSSLFCNTA